MLMSGDIPRGSLCTTNAVSHLIEELQDTLGEGPCVDAYQRDRVVAEPDLADPATRRWSPSPCWRCKRACERRRVPAAGGHGVAGGAQPVPGLVWWLDRWSARGRAGAGRCGRPLGAGSPGRGAPGRGCPGTGERRRLPLRGAQRGRHRLGPAADLRHRGVIRLRAYAFSSDRLLADAAEDVIARRVRLQ